MTKNISEQDLPAAEQGPEVGIHHCDPEPPHWEGIELPQAWPDSLSLSSWSGLQRFWREVIRAKPRPVQLPDDLMGREIIPKYAQQEFHSLPNGVYSRHVSRGYITGFDISMLGSLRTLRAWIAETLLMGHRVKAEGAYLDLGCAGGKVAAALCEAGAKDVWGLDPSPYLLKHAQYDYPEIPFVQGVAEDIPFPDNRFDGVAICFLFHEMPPRYIKRALAEISRVLKPGGKLVIAEPSPSQLFSGWWRMVFLYGVEGLYFKWLAHFVHEPFLLSWHKFDLVSSLDEVGMSLEFDEKEMPVRRIIAIKKR